MRRNHSGPRSRYTLRYLQVPGLYTVISGIHLCSALAQAYGRPPGPVRQLARKIAYTHCSTVTSMSLSPNARHRQCDQSTSTCIHAGNNPAHALSQLTHAALALATMLRSATIVPLAIAYSMARALYSYGSDGSHPTVTTCPSLPHFGERFTSKYCSTRLTFKPIL